MDDGDNQLTTLGKFEGKVLVCTSVMNVRSKLHYIGPEP